MNAKECICKTVVSVSQQGHVSGKKSLRWDDIITIKLHSPFGHTVTEL